MLSTLILKVINKLYKLYGVHKRLDPKVDSVLLLGDGLDQFDKVLCQLLVVKYKCRVLHLGPSNVSCLDDFDTYQWFQCDFSKKESLHDAMHRVGQSPRFPTVLINDLVEETGVDTPFGVSSRVNSEHSRGNSILGSILTIRLFLQLSLPKEGGHLHNKHYKRSISWKKLWNTTRKCRDSEFHIRIKATPRWIIRGINSKG